MKKMKNRKIIFVSLLAVFILMMLPAVNAVEYNTVVKANETRILDKIKNINIQALKGGTQKGYIGDLIEEIDNLGINGVVEKLKEKFKDNPALPQCIRSILDIIIEFLYNLFTNTPFTLIIIIFVIGQIFGGILGIVLAVVVLSGMILVEPSIEFEPNYDSNTLTVMSVDHNYTLWPLIENNGTGFYNTSGLGLFVEVGDIITECSGEISLIYRPTNIQYERFVFS